MNGTITVWCVRHRMQVRVTAHTARNAIRHVRHGDECGSERFTVRHEWEVGPGGATHQLALCNPEPLS
jgi:hypothetical protein